MDVNERIICSLLVLIFYLFFVRRIAGPLLGYWPITKAMCGFCLLYILFESWLALFLMIWIVTSILALWMYFVRGFGRPNRVQGELQEEQKARGVAWKARIEQGEKEMEEAFAV